jgi:hypothetical protein
MEYSWKVSLLESWRKIASFGPSLLQLIIIIILGFIVAWLLKLVVRYLLTLIKFDVLSYRVGISSTLTKASISRTPTEVVGLVIYCIDLCLYSTVCDSHFCFSVGIFFEQILKSGCADWIG